MRFADIKGNDDIKKALVSMADTGRVAHAMLLYENEGCGALALALAYVQYLDCPHRHDGDSCGECPSCNRVSRLIHPDLHFIYPVNSGSRIPASAKPTSESYLQQWRELAVSNPYFLESQLYEALGIENKSGNIAVADAKYILEKLSLTSVEDGYKRVLQTISSRCQGFRVLPSTKADVAATLVGRFSFSEEDAGVLSGISGGSVGVALRDAGESAEYSIYMDIFSDMLKAAHEKDLLSVLEASEQIAALESRERQKAFCSFAGDCLRKIYMVQQGMEALSNMKPGEEEFFSSAARWCSPSFCEKILGQIDRSSALIDRNVSAKIVFCDLADRIFLSI